MNYALPVTVAFGGEEHRIRSDFRAILDICEALSDSDLSNDEKAVVTLNIFYPDVENIPEQHYYDAVKACFNFINLGADERAGKPAPKLVSWEQDFQYIVSPVNHVIGREIRSLDYLHWWTFIAAYYEIGDCTFAQIVRIRDMRRRGKALDKADSEWYRRNRDLVDMKHDYSEQENEILKKWGGV